MLVMVPVTMYQSVVLTSFARKSGIETSVTGMISSKYAEVISMVVLYWSRFPTMVTMSPAFAPLSAKPSML